jgi:hypothetical protein
MLTFSGEAASINIARRSGRSTSRGAFEYPRPIRRASAQAGNNRILANVIHLCRELFPAFIGAQAMIEETFLPLDPVGAGVKMFPTANDAAHRLIARNREEGMQVIRHKQEQCDVPVLFVFVETGRIEQFGRKLRRSQRLLVFLTIKHDSDMKQRARFNPMRDSMMKL